MKNETTQSIYKVQKLPNLQYSLLNDKGEVIPLPIGKVERDQFEWLYIHNNGFIKAKHNGKYYAFKLADLTPIELFIKGEYRVAFYWLKIHDNGIIEAIHNARWYAFKLADLTPIALVINGKRVVVFTALNIHDNGFITAKHGKWYGFNPDLTPIERVINGEPVVAFTRLYIHDNGEIEANHNGKWYDFNAMALPS